MHDPSLLNWYLGAAAVFMLAWIAFAGLGFLWLTYRLFDSLWRDYVLGERHKRD